MQPVTSLSNKLPAAGLKEYKENATALVEETKIIFRKNLIDYCEKSNIKIDLLPEGAIEQLLWYQKNSVTTPEAAGSEGGLNYEGQRCLSRANCLSLLEAKNYNDFIEPQKNKPNQLSLASFEFFHFLITSLSEEAKTAIQASCYITMTDAVKMQLDNEKIAYPHDSEQFLTFVSEKYPDFYPVYKNLDRYANSVSRDLISKHVFPEGCHFRQMLFIEGGQNMYENISVLIRSSKMTTEQINAWLTRWIVNIAGFNVPLNGQYQKRGSIFLTEDIAVPIIFLAKLVQSISEKQLDQSTIINTYISYLKQVTGLEHSFAVRLAANMKIFTQDEAKGICEWCNKLPENKKQEFEQWNDNFMKNVQTTPTYFPAVCSTLKKMVNENKATIEESLSLLMLLQQQALNLYLYPQQSNQGQPLSFFQVYNEKSLDLILKEYRQHGSLSIQLNDKSEVVYEQPGLLSAFSYVTPKKLFCEHS